MTGIGMMKRDKIKPRMRKSKVQHTTLKGQDVIHMTNPAEKTRKSCLRDAMAFERANVGKLEGEKKTYQATWSAHQVQSLFHPQVASAGARYL